MFGLLGGVMARDVIVQILGIGLASILSCLSLKDCLSLLLLRKLCWRHGMDLTDWPLECSSWCVHLLVEGCCIHDS
jgi:hypothetical protein